MIACRQLQRIVAQLRPDLQLLCMLDSVEESVEFLQGEQPDLIFMDVELGDGTCFDILKYVEVRSPVIFITAYSRYAIEAFRINAVDYLLKPVNSRDVEKALEKLEAMRAVLVQGNDLIRGAETSIRSERILIVKHSMFSYINISDIAFFKFEDRYISAYTFDGESEITEMKSISEVMKCLQNYDFFQLSRGIVANIRAILKIRKIDSHRIEVEIGIGDKVLETVGISSQRRRNFLQWLGK